MRGAIAVTAAVALAVAACSSFLVGPDASVNRVGLFESVWSDLDRQYAFFSVKGVNWDSLHDAYAPQAGAAATDSALGELLGAMLSNLHDIHVNLFAGPRSYDYTGYQSRPAFFDPDVVAYYVNDRGGAPNGHIAFGHAAPDVGYVWILHFDGTGFAADIDAALTQLTGARGVIIDVRGNPGGRLSNMVAAASRFADRTRTYGFIRFRNGPAHDDLSTPEPQVIAPAGPRRFSGSVVVLTNRRSLSAAEGFVLAMRARPNVTIVGDSTGGASGGPLGRELPNGWTYRFSASMLCDTALVPFEEVGLAPDVWVRGSAEELSARRDAVLDTALVVIRRALH